MILLNAAAKCPNWDPKMQDWVVTSISYSIGSLGRKMLLVLTEHPCHFGATRHEALDIDWPFSVIPDRTLLNARTLAEFDRMLCPEGLIYVWEEQLAQEV